MVASTQSSETEPISELSSCPSGPPEVHNGDELVHQSFELALEDPNCQVVQLTQLIRQHRSDPIRASDLKIGTSEDRDVHFKKVNLREVIQNNSDREDLVGSFCHFFEELSKFTRKHKGSVIPAIMQCEATIAAKLNLLRTGIVMKLDCALPLRTPSWSFCPISGT